MAKRRAGRTKRRTPKKMSKGMSKAMRRGKKTKKRSSKRKGKKPASNWNKHMMMVYKSMKAKNPSVKLGDAMKAAKKTYNKGRPLSMSVDGGGRGECGTKRRFKGGRPKGMLQGSDGVPQPSGPGPNTQPGHGAPAPHPTYKAPAPAPATAPATAPAQAPALKR